MPSTSCDRRTDGAPSRAKVSGELAGEQQDLYIMQCSRNLIHTSDCEAPATRRALAFVGTGALTGLCDIAVSLLVRL